VAWTELVQAITTGGAIVVLVWVLRHLISERGDMVPRWALADEQKEKDEWKAIALSALKVAETGTKVAERVAGRK